MSNMFEQAHTLLNIVEKCAGHGGKLSALSNAAMAELLEMNGLSHKEAMAKRERTAAAEAAQAEETVEETEDTTLKPSVFPRDSQTATIADANIDRRL